MGVVVQIAPRTPARPSNPSPPYQGVFDEREIAQWIGRRVEEADRGRRETLEIAHTAIEHFDGTRGKQWGRWKQAAGALVYNAAPAWRVRRTVNVTQGTAITIEAKVGLQRPRFKFGVGDGSAEAIQTAKMAEKWQRWWYRDQGIDRQRWKMVGLLTITGTAYKKVYVDPDRGEPIPDPETGEEVYSGRVVSEIVHLQELIVDPAVDEIYDESGKPKAAWVAHQSFITRDEALTLYPKAEDVIGEETENGGGGWYEDDRVLDPRRDSATPKGGQVKRLEFYHRPTRTHPHGFMVVLLNGKYVAGGELPYHRDTRGKIVFPFIHYRSHIYVPGKFYRLAPTWVMEGLQKALNRRYSSGEEYELTMAYGRVLYDEGSVQNPEDLIASENFGLISIEPGHRDPRFNEPKPLPAGWWQGNNELYGMVKEVTLVRDVSRGAAPPNAKTAAGQYLMKRADDDVLAPFAFEIEQAEEQELRMASTLEATYGSEGELRTLVNEDGTSETFSFRRSFLRDVPGIAVEQGSLYPQDEMLKQAALSQLVELGVISKDEMRRRLDLKIAEDEPDSIEARSRRIALWENKLMLRGQFPPVRDRDVDPIHLYEHQLLQNTSEYEQAPLAVQEIIDAHVLLTKRQIARKAMEAAALMQLAAPAMEGGGAGGGGAPGAPQGSPRNPAGPPSRQPQGEGPGPGFTMRGAQNSQNAARPAMPDSRVTGAPQPVGP